MSEQHLTTYMQDHLAGSTAALQLMQHLQKIHAGTDLERFFAQLHTDIGAERDELENLLSKFTISGGTLRCAAAWFAEKAMQMKLRLDDVSSGNLRLLEAVELIATGIEGKRGLWLALGSVSTIVPKLHGPEYDRLVAQSVEQRQRIEPIRLNAARAAFSE